MWTFPERTRRWLPGSLAGHGFRRRFLLALMLVVAALTAAAVGLAEHHLGAAYRRGLEERFGEQTTALLATREARRAAISDKCRGLARSVRIRAALEESDVEDLYRNARDDLREVLGLDDAAPARDGPLPRASFFGFLDAAGTPLSPPRADDAGAADAGDGSAAAGLTACAGQFAAPPRAGGGDADGAARRAAGPQEIGYLARPTTRGGGDTRLEEIVATRIGDTATGEDLGTLILGFPPERLDAPRSPGTTALGGIWLGDQVYLLPGADAATGVALAGQLRAAVTRSGRAADHFPVAVAGAPHLLFYQALDVGPRFPRAYQVCLYPLADSLGEQRALRWQIIGWGAATLLVGFAVSWRVARGLSAPVERLAVAGAENLAGRRVAEAELLAANAQLERTLAELRATQAKVIQQERLRALGEMASGIAHDFNNALMPILGFSELLLHVPGVLDNRPKVLGYLQTINRGARDAGNVVRRLREFYRGREADEAFVPVDVAELVGQLGDLTRPKWKDQAQSRGGHVTWRAEIEPGLPPVAGHGSDLREALTNLVFNAVDAMMPRGGQVTVRARRAAAGAQVALEVSDTGTGMSEEVRRRCLEPFFTTKGDRGTGLGLSMVFGIAERHRGSVEIDSQPGEGSTFRLLLPVYEATAAPGPPAPAKPTAGNGGGLRVLVVDDEPHVRDILVRYLESDGHHVRTAGAAREALEEFRAHAFDLVLTDMAMPSMSGEQLAATLKELRPEVPVVLLTGFGAFLDPVHRALGVDAVAGKPITLEGLRQSIASALRTRREGVATP